jgi:PrtD family type I secretion system ABC transporter
MKANHARDELTGALAGCTSFFTMAALFSCAINLLYLASPLYMLQVYDRVLSSGSEYTLVMLTVALGAALATMAGLDAVRARVLVRAGIKFDRRLSGRVLTGLVERGVHPGGARHGQSLRDLDHLRQFLTGPGVHAAFDAPWMPIYIAVLFLVHPLLGWVALGGAALLLLLAMFNEFATRGPLKVATEAAVRSYGFTDATLRNAEVIQAMGMLPALGGRWLHDRQEMLGYQASASERNADFSGLIKFSRLFLQSLVLGIGAWLVIERAITPGSMFAGTLLLGRGLAPVEQAVAVWKQFITAREARRRIRELLMAQPPRPVAMALPAPEGRISVERLVYGPPGADKPILKGISFELGAGEALGLIGPSAAGKSTLARLLVGVWKASHGAVRLDGADVFTWERGHFGAHVGYVPQDVELFAGTVRDNISRFAAGDPELIVAAARRAGVHDMILRLPKGYDTEIGESGAVLSGGQRQRLALARALYGSPRLLVLDEPNANLDAEGEQALVKALTAARAEGTTIVVIAHRPAVIGMVDKILVLRDGLIDMYGPREDVVAKLGGTGHTSVVRPVAFAGGKE